MCQIIYKPAGVDLPDVSIFERASASNPHGIGLMYPENGQITIYKMRMEAKVAYDTLKHIATGGIDWLATPLVVHFRMATHGDKSDANCHPFPVTDDDELLGARYCQADVGLAHNGVVYLLGTSPTKTENKSDTYEMVQLYFPKFRLATFQAAHRIIDEEILKGDRMIVMDGTGEVVQWGNWHNHDGGFQTSTWFSSTYGMYNEHERRWFGHNSEYSGYDMFDYTPDDYPERGQVTPTTPVINTAAEICDICREPLRFIKYYRDDCVLCDTCYKTFYRDHSDKRFLKTADGELLLVDRNNNAVPKKTYITDVVDQDYYMPYYEDSFGRVFCTNCREFDDKDNSIIFTMADDSVCIICGECNDLLQLNLIEMQADTKVRKINIGHKVKRM